MNKTLSILCGCLLFAVPSLRAQVFSTNADGFIYTTTNAAITITGYIGTNSSLTIPAAISNMLVGSVGNDAFAGNRVITNLIMANTVTNIGDYAFVACQILSSITLSTNLVSIGQFAFSAPALDPDHYYRNDYGCSFSSVTIPDSVIDIGPYAFYGCQNMTNVVLGAGLTSIGTNVFGNDIALATITIPNNVIKIEGQAFYGCPYLTQVTLSTNLTSIGSEAFSGAAFKGDFGSPNYACNIPNIIIPDSVTNIGDYAFYNCWNLTNVFIGTNVVAIGAGAFSGFADPGPYSPAAVDYACHLTMVSIPNSVTSIGANVFNNCQYLTNVTFGTNIGSIGDSAFSGSAAPSEAYPLVDYACPLTSVTIPDSVTNLGNAVFYNGQLLTNVILGRGVVSIGTNAFSGLTGVWPVPDISISITTNYACPLEGITIPDSVTNIGDFAFYNCSSLASIHLGANVAAIGNSTFSGDLQVGAATKIFNFACPLTNVLLPESVITIGTNAFYGCQYLASVTFGNNLASIGNSAFSGELYYEYQSENSEEISGPLAASYACPLSGISLPDSLTNIGTNAFSYCAPTSFNVAPNNPAYSSRGGVLFNQDQTTLIEYPSRGSLSAYAIPGTVTNIDAWAFYGCDFTNITIPDSVTSIGQGAFYQSALAAVSIPGSVTDIGAGAFEYSALANVAISNCVIAKDQFYDCTNLAGVTIPSSVTNVGDNAFANSALTSAIVSNSVIGNYQFDQCSNLTSLTIGTNLATIGTAAFLDCVSLTNFALPNTLTTIGDNAFSDCSSLTSLTLPDNATNLGGGIFMYCSNLASVALPGTLAVIPSAMFSDCASLRNVTIPNGVVNIGPTAFSDCPLLTNVTIAASVTAIEMYAFYNSPLAEFYFEGNAPTNADPNAFGGDPNSIAYYLPGTPGWGTTLGGIPTGLWTLPNPMILPNSIGFSGPANGFGFTISWATNLPVIVEACTDLAAPVWQPLQTNALTNGVFNFTDPQWANYPARFYRVRAQ